MNVRVIGFATVGEILGRPGTELTLAAGSRIADLRRELEARHPELETIWPRLAVAVGGALVSGETVLQDGDEVALLPPVSGGAPRSYLTDQPLDVEAVRRSVERPGCGAVVVFVGAVRDTACGRAVERLTYTAYRPLAERALARIAEEIASSEAGLAIAIAHRVGEVAVGVPSVVIAVAAPHRDAAYRASREALERLKREVPVWKLEHYADGAAVWREEEPLSKAAHSVPPAAASSAVP